MKTLVKLSAVVLVGFAVMLCSGCASAPKESGFLGNNYAKLQPSPQGGVSERWLKPGVDFSKYNKVMVDSVVFYFADESEDKGIDPEQMKELSDAFNQQFADTLKDKYPMVAEPGPDVLRVRIALTNIKKSKPVLSTVTSIIPVGIVVSTVKKTSEGSWAGSGATTAEAEILDSMSNDVVAVALDRQTAGFWDRFSSLGSAKAAFKTWAERIVSFLDFAHAVKQ